jgi:hypothetical protein
LILAAAPAFAQSRIEEAGPSLSPEPSVSAPPATMSFHRSAAPPAPAAPERTFIFRKQASPPPTAWNAAAPVVRPRFGDPMLALQAPKKDPAPAPRAASDDSRQYQISLELPGPGETFKLDSEADFQERLRQQARSSGLDNRIVFPDEPVVSRERYKGRSLAPAVAIAEPYNVCHGRLLFEEINAERYGWDLGALQPFVSASAFYLNLATVPYHLFTRPCQKYECSAGYCLPGDPVPYMLYPPELSLTGALAEAGAAVGLVGIFP